MKQSTYLFGKSGLLVALALLLTLLLTPSVSAAHRTQQQKQNNAATTINATFYLATATLQSLFQSRMDQQVPQAVNDGLNTLLNQLPVANRGWASQMVNTLIQPSATLTSLTTQQDGLVANIQVSLYPGDPQPIAASMLVKFSVENASTIQVSAQAMNGSPALANGPLTPVTLPIGQLHSIATTPSCGDAMLGVNLNIPTSLGSSGAHANAQVRQTSFAQASFQQPDTTFSPAMPLASTTAYVEIPASSLASLGASIGTLPINGALNAQNIRISVRGSQLVITSDIALGMVKVATATTYADPIALNGNLAIKVVKTNATVLVFTFPENAYNQQIEQALNTRLNGALAGKFTVTNAVIGANNHVPCAAGDSLLLSGTTHLI